MLSFSHLRVRFVLGLVVFLLTMLHVVANAATITTITDHRGAFTLAAGGLLATENFNGFTSDSQFRTKTVDVGAFSLSKTGNFGFSNRNKIDAPPLTIPSFNVDGTTIVNVTIGGPVIVTFTFDSPITAFGADFAGLNSDFLRTKIIVGGTNTLVPYSTVGPVVRFFGFVSYMPFQTVQFQTNTGLNNGFGIDNVAFAPPVPTPSALMLFGTGLVALIGWRRLHVKKQ